MVARGVARGLFPAALLLGATLGQALASLAQLDHRAHGLAEVFPGQGLQLLAIDLRLKLIPEIALARPEGDLKLSALRAGKLQAASVLEERRQQRALGAD